MPVEVEAVQHLIANSPTTNRQVEAQAAASQQLDKILQQRIRLLETPHRFRQQQ